MAMPARIFMYQEPLTMKTISILPWRF